jgi:hypothetical protein
MRRSLSVVGTLATALLLLFSFTSCSNPGGSSGGGGSYTASSAPSAIDGRTDAWVNNELAAEDGSTPAVSPHPTVTFSFGANAGPEGTNDGAAQVVYSGETGSNMYLMVFPRISLLTLPTSGPVTISAKVKPVGGCVKLATAFVGEAQSGATYWHETTTPISLAADAWTTVSVTVTPSSFSFGVYRVGIALIGDASHPHVDHGTIFIDDFNALDYNTNDFSSLAQLNNAELYTGKDAGMGGSVSSWGNSGSPAGDGYFIHTITFPNPITSGVGAWAGMNLAPSIYSTTVPLDLSHSTLTFKIYIPSAFFNHFSPGLTGTWMSIYDATHSTLIYYGNLVTLAAGWNTVSIDFADSRLQLSANTSNTSYNYASVTGMNVGFGSGDSALNGLSYDIYCDYVKVVQN